MWKKKLCINISPLNPLPLERQLDIIKEIGFDGFFIVWSADMDVAALSRHAASLGLSFQSLHAPWGKCRALWREDPEAAGIAVQELLACVDACAENAIPILIVHPIIGFAEPPATPMGLPRFEQVVTYAAQKGIRIAFENTEGEDYLKMLMDHFRDCPNVGFCWDTGHEMCYNHSQDLLALYGDRLICTHLNDNLGIRDFDGQISPKDDLHLLPFDGVGDWQDITARLKAWNYSAELTFELKIVSKHKRPENALYEKMDYEAFITEAYKRACRVGYLLLRQK